MAPPAPHLVDHQTAPRVRAPLRAWDVGVRGPAAVLACTVLAVAAMVADAVSGEARLGLVGLAAMALALALVLWQAERARVGRPRRVSRLAARTGTASSLVVATSLSVVGVLERLGPEVTDSAAFAAGVAVLSVLLLVVLPLALVVFGWVVWRDRRLDGGLRVLPGIVLLVVALAAVAVALTDGRRELWLHAAAVAVAGAALSSFSAGSSRAGDRLAL
jgi:hypothetical protein